MRRWKWTILLVVVTAASLGGAALGQNLPKLPGEIVLQSPDSPGKVTFLHESHMGDRPDCTRCHPKLFSIVKQAKRSPERTITHKKMEKGAQCGACHNGKVSFGFDDCSACHR